MTNLPTTLEEVVDSLREKGMSENAIKFMARKQGIDFDEDTPDQFNRNLIDN